MSHQNLSLPILPPPMSAKPPFKHLTYWCSALILSGMLSVTAGGLFSGAATADATQMAEITQKPVTNKPVTAQFPRAMANRLRQDLSKRTGISIGKLRVLEATPKTWSNGCLGLMSTNEFCTEALVDGWRVVLTDGKQRWAYRTDRQGAVYRLELTAKPVSTSPAKPEKEVTQVGTAIRPTQMPLSELPPPLESQAVFRSISSGGFAGLTYQTTLLANGQVVRVLMNPSGAKSTPQVHQVSQQQMKQFRQLLEQHSLAKFNRMNYPAAPGSADFLTVTLTSRSGTLRYADSIQGQLPQSIQAIIRAWNEMTRDS